MRDTVRRDPFRIGPFEIAAGERRTVDLPFSLLSNHTPMTLPVQVVHGKKPGPVLFISGVVHGDEVLGVEIIRRILKKPQLSRLAGTLLAIPVVNAYGLISHSRYLPDRRDLNRSFPGSERGSLAAQLADLFRKEIVARSDVGIDLHTAALHRTNLPQLRVARYSGRMRELADAFGAPLVMEANLRHGSLRETALAMGVDVLLYEAGEALRFDEEAIRVGERGIVAVMHRLGMLPGHAPKPVLKAGQTPLYSRKSFWIRAPEGGIFRALKLSGHRASAGELLGVVADPFGDTEFELHSPHDGLIIGHSHLPVVNQGDALFHVAKLTSAGPAVAEEGEAHERDTLFDEDEII